jgi:putative ABC transport system substrate-binding protein
MRAAIVCLASVAAAGVATAAIAAEARIPRIGYLLARGSQPGIDGAFFKRLQELGYIEGKNIVIERRFADGKFDQLPRLVQELIDLKVEIIVAAPFPAAHAAKQATTTIPIVMLSGGDPVGVGLVNSMARPGGNVTGVSNQATEVIPKMLELLHAAVPDAKRIALMVNPANPIHASYRKGFEDTATALGVGAMIVHATGPGEFESAFDAAIRGRVTGVIVPQDPMFLDQRARLIEHAAKRRLPMMAPFREFTTGGGLMSYGRNLREGFVRLADYVDKILLGAKPADLPVQQPTKFEFVINLRTAKALGIEIPTELLLRADEIIR